MRRLLAPALVALALFATACDEAKEAYEKADLITQTGEQKEALSAFKVVIENYGDTEWAPKAKKRMSEIHADLARKEVENRRAGEAEKQYDMAIGYAEGEDKKKIEEEKKEQVELAERKVLAATIEASTKADAVDISKDRKSVILWRRRDGSDFAAYRYEAVTDVLGKMDMFERVFSHHGDLQTAEVRVYRLDPVKNEKMPKVSFTIARKTLEDLDRKEFRNEYMRSKAEDEGDNLNNPKVKAWWDKAMTYIEKGDGWQ